MKRKRILTLTLCDGLQMHLMRRQPVSWGGEAIRGWVAPVSSTSFHLTGYPGDLKFPGWSDQYFPIFRLVGNKTKCWIFRWTDWSHAAGFYWEQDWRYPRPTTSWWQGKEEGRWKTRQVEPGGVEEWGGSRFFIQGGQEGLNTFKLSASI